MKKTIIRTFKKLFPNTFGKSVSRISLDIELKRQFKNLAKGVTLDVGSKTSPYKKYIPSSKYMRLDIDPKKGTIKSDESKSERGIFIVFASTAWAPKKPNSRIASTALEIVIKC